jgi:hypothetical protein
MDLVTIAPARERPSACSSSRVTQSAPDAFMKQVENFTPAMVVLKSMLILSHSGPS